MGKNSLIKLSALLILISLTCLINAQEVNEYEKIKQMAAGTWKEPEPERTEEMGEREETTQEDKELYNKQAVFPALNQRFFCEPSGSQEKVYEDVMKNHNYQKIMYRYKSFVLYVKAVWCDFCCQHEQELRDLKELLKGKHYLGEEIPIVMLDSHSDVNALRELGIGLFKVPSLYFVKEKKFVQYNSFFKSNNILKFVNNMLNPVITLETVEEVETFFQTDSPLEEKSDFLGETKLEISDEFEHPFRIRTIGFFTEPEEYSAEFTNFHDYADKVAYRPDLRIAIVTDPAIVKHFKSMYDGVWFNSHSLNSIVMKRIEKVMFLDLSLLNELLEVFMVYNSMPFVDELSMNNNDIMKNVVTPIALFFIDASYILPNYHNMIKFIMNLSKRYIGKYVFMFMDGNTKNKSKEQLGLQKDSRNPTLIINYLKSGKTKPLPNKVDFSDVEIMKFLDENYNAKASASNELGEFREKISMSYDHKIVRNLKLATKIEKKNFEKIIYNKKYDVVMFVVDTDYDKDSEKLALYVNRLCERFKSLGTKTVLFTYYDINENGPLNHNNVGYEIGDVVIVPNNKKEEIKFNENMTMLRLMKFIEKNANQKIRLPDTPHIDLDLQELYYKKKATLESYEENFDKTDFEIDELISLDFGQSKNAQDEKTDL